MECTSIFSPVQATCNMWLPNRHRHCMNKAGLYKERQYAERLRLATVDGECQKSTELVESLMEFAEMVHCRNSHRTHQQIMATVCCWTAELDLSNCSSRYRGTHISETTPYLDPWTPTNFSPLQIRNRNVISPLFQTLLYALPVGRADTTLTTRSYALPVARSVAGSRTHNFEFPPSPPPYTPPVTRSQTANRTQATASRPTPPRFEPRRISQLGTLEAIADLVSKPFGRIERKQGYIYMFTRDSDPGYVKIGWSTNVTRRMREWEQRCHYKPVLVYTSPLIPHAFRAEQLIFTQLAEWRYDDMRCINEDICRSQHKEWFRLRKRDAFKVVKRWVWWVMTSPFLEDGWLEDRSYLDRWLELCHKNPTGSDLDLDFGCELPDSTAEDDKQDDSDSEDDSNTRNERKDESSDSEESEPDSGSSVDDECAICYEGLGPPTERMLPPCTVCRNDPWHDECIRKWIEMSPLCPMCRGRNRIDVPASGER